MSGPIERAHRLVYEEPSRARKTVREIRPIGTTCRVLVGLGLLYLALLDGRSWGLLWHEAALGLVAFPAVMVAVGLAAQRFAGRSIHFMGPAGFAVNSVGIVVLVLIDYTADAVVLFYGTTLFVAAWRAQAGCEATVLSNWILGRDDQIGCPAFTPIDEAEARLAARTTPSVPPLGDPEAGERNGKRIGAFGPTHLVACVGAGASAVLVINMLDWL